MSADNAGSAESEKSSTAPGVFQTPLKPELIVYVDIVCPFAYIGVCARLDDIVRVTGASCLLKPVVLGSLYDMTKAPQGKDGSATDIMPAAKLARHKEDFQRELRRYQLPLKMHPQHPLKSVDAGRLICAFPPEHRLALAKALYKAYWVDNLNIASRPVLLRIARSLKLTSLAVRENIDCTL